MSKRSLSLVTAVLVAALAPAALRAQSSTASPIRSWSWVARSAAFRGRPI